jgi:hypothetical protein
MGFLWRVVPTSAGVAEKGPPEALISSAAPFPMVGALNYRKRHLALAGIELHLHTELSK